MPEIKKEEHLIATKSGRTISLDIHFHSKLKSEPLILFCHGFKGFKDWGCNNLIAEKFTQSDFVFVKFNFSLNGVHSNDLSDITDFEAFGQNNFTSELEDLKEVIDWLENPDNPYNSYYDINSLTLLGHSRGGSIAIIQTIEDPRVKKIICWAPVLDLEKYAELKDPIDWMEEPALITNGRTGDVYPIDYQFYEDYTENKKRLDIQQNIAKLDKPLFIVHGENDEAVPIAHSKTMYEFVSHSLFIPIENGNHTFGATHPWEDDDLPEQLNDVVEECIEFFEL